MFCHTCQIFGCINCLTTGLTVSYASYNLREDTQICKVTTFGVMVRLKKRENYIN